MAVIAAYFVGPLHAFEFMILIPYLIRTLNKILGDGAGCECVLRIMKEIQGLYELLDAIVEPVDSPPVSLTNGGMEISLRDVSVRHPNGMKAVDGVSAHIKSGQIVLLTGTCSSGKTSLLNALLRLLPTSDGELLLDGRPATEYAADELRRSAVYLSQGEAVLPLSLRENVLLGARTDDAKCADMLAQRALDLANFVSTPELQLDSLIERVAMVDESIAKNIGSGAIAMREAQALGTGVRLSRPSECESLPRVHLHACSQVARD